MSDLVRWLGLIVLCVAACGCAHVRYKDFEHYSFEKDIAAEIELDDQGRPRKIILNSNVNAQIARSIAEGVAKGLKP